MGKQPIPFWLACVAALALTASLSGCGGSDGAAGPAGPAGPTGPAGPAGPPGSAAVAGAITVGSNTATNADVINANAAQWADLQPTVTITSVTIASPPVVNFKVADAFGKPVIGLGNTGKGSTDTVANYTNLSFAIAKLVPGTAGSPSKWVSYIVTRVPTTNAATVSGNNCPANTVCPTTPSSDNTGTLVDNGDGTYKYTFYRDITTMPAQLAALPLCASNACAPLGDVTYAPSLTHRVAIQLSGNAPGTGQNTPTKADATASGFPGVPMKHPANAVYDFIPATGAAVAASDFSREIVATENCAQCHRVLGGLGGLDNAEDSATFHGSSRNNTQYCVLCHTDQRGYGRTEATPAANGSARTFTSQTYIVDGRTVGNFPNYIHKVHAGPVLANQNYNYANVLLNETTYPQDVRNCNNCHDGVNNSSASTITKKTKDGDAWLKNPSMLACGACHDGINFKTGTGVTLADAAKGLTNTPNAHPAGPLADDSQCALCHKSNGTFPAADINLAHFPVTPPNPKNALVAGGTNAFTNAAWIASGGSVGRLPPGAITVTWDVKSVSRDANKHPVMVFRWLQNGTAVPITPFATAQANPNPATGQPEMWPNFMGAPSAYFVFAVPQDGIAAPADFNASASAWIKGIWNGTAAGASAGTLTGPDGSGYYTVTLTGVTVPDNAVMLTGGMGYTYTVTSTLPLTQTNLTDYPVTAATAAGQTNKQGGLIVIAPNVQKVGTGYTGRRVIVADAKCNACHQELGTFTEDAFHAGQRNDGTTCSWCHNPNKATGQNNGWTADSTYFVHGIHASAKRVNTFTWEPTLKPGAPAGSTNVNDYETFAKVTYPGILNDCATCHVPGAFDYSTSSQATLDSRLLRTTAGGTMTNTLPLAPFGGIAAGNNYGALFSYNAATGVTTPAAGTTLVMSPTVAVCSACHDSADAITHFTVNQGSYYVSRTTAATQNETCLVCHGTGRIADIAVMHAKNR